MPRFFFLQGIEGGLDGEGTQGNLGPVAPLSSIPKRLLYLFICGFVFRLILALLPERYLFYVIYDDAYYYFAVAKNLTSRGMLSVDGFHLTNGFHPLWLFVLIPIFFIFQGSLWVCVRWAVAFSAVFDTAAAWFIYKTLERLGRKRAGFWAAAFYLFNPYGLLHTMNGLETAQNSFLLAVLVYLSVRATSDWLKTGWPVLGTMCGFALLSRTDNVFVVGALCGYFFWRERAFVPVLRIAAVASLLVLPWLVFNFFTFGTVLQTSAGAFPSFHHHQQYLSEHSSYWRWALIPHLLRVAYESFVLNAYHYGNWVLTLLLSAVLARQMLRRPGAFRPLAWTLAGAALFAAFHILVRWTWRLWYPQAIFVLTLPLVALALEKLNPKWIALGGVAALALGAWVVWVCPFQMIDRYPLMLDIINRRIPPGDRVGAFNSGYLQYFTDRRVLNLDGVVNNEIIPYYEVKEGLAYLRKERVRWIMDTPLFLGGIFGSYFGPGVKDSLALAYVVPNIVYRGNTVIVAQVQLDSVPLPPEKKTLFAKLIEVWKTRPASRNWGGFQFFPKKYSKAIGPPQK